ncbi:MAG: aspartate aminotransferase family protein [Methanomassiliicoccales archaeon]|jgi:acetylornithine aminotransferase/acetylornithine/N-succinyldiaminopimelate aminotransferase
MNLGDVKKLTESYLFQNYSREEICFERGEKEYLYDLEGNEYLDLVAGIAVSVLGHCHPAVVDAVCRQAKKLAHVSNLYLIKEQADLARSIASIVPSPLGMSLFVNSGAEANEAALKLAVKYTSRARFVTARNSFHGRTVGSLSATGQPKYHSGFEPLILPAFDFIEYGSSEQLKNSVNPGTAAVILEPIQGEGGIIVPPVDFMRTARDVCDDSGALLILDEVQTGFGRTGKMFAFEHYGIVPDVITVAKALGGGFPIGALVTSPEISKVFTPGTHGSTFGGNPFVCSVAQTVISTIKAEGLVERSAKMGRMWMSKLRSIPDEREFIEDVRGKGLMIGVEMGEEAKKLQKVAFTERILVNVCAGNVVRLVPPLIVGQSSVDRFDEVLRSFVSIPA